MKKLLALLMACTTMTCMFASCGNEESENSDSKESSVSAESSEETTEEETTEEETTEEETTEEETTEEETAEVAEGGTDDAETSEVEITTHEYIEDADPTAFLGKWECEKMIIDGEEATDLMGIPLYAAFQLEIKDDNTAVMGEALAESSGTSETLKYTWGMVSETELEIVDENGSAMLLTIDGDYIIGTEEGFDEEIYLVKVDEFTPFDIEEFLNSFEEDTSTDTETETVAE